jgi:hypothetical protein
MAELIAGPGGIPEDQKGDASGEAYVNAGAGAAVAVAGVSNTNVGTDTPYTFASTVHHIALQNNTAAALNYNFDATATAGSFALAAGALVLFDVPCTVLHLLTAAAQSVNGATAAGIVLKGWA